MTRVRQSSREWIIPKRAILDVPVAEIGWQEAKDAIGSALDAGDYLPVAFLNAHGVNIAAKDPGYAASLQSFLVLPDGIGVDLASRAIYGAPFPANLNGTDFVPDWLKTMPQSRTVGLLGATPLSIENAFEHFKRLAPQHRFVMVHNGFFDETAEKAILDQLSTLKPDILLVAMGIPRQELWIAQKLTPSHCTIPVAVGALFDFVGGTLPRAPSVIRQMRLEWLYRLLIEPRRLFARYVLGIPVFFWRVVRHRRNGNPRG